MAEPYTKTPSERIFPAVNYAADLPSGVTVSSCVVSAWNDAGVDVSATILETTTATVVGGTKAVANVKAGTANENYLIKFLATLSDTQVWEDHHLVEVTNDI